MILDAFGSYHLRERGHGGAVCQRERCKDVGAGGGMPDAVLETGVPLTCAADVGCEQSVEYWTSTATGDWSPRAPHLSVVELRRYVEETKRAVLNGEVMYYVAL